MKTDLWKECLNCESRCCDWKKFSFPLYLTSEEKNLFVKIKNKPNHPCVFLNKKKLCDIYSTRPIDCRFFPFDIMKINGEFFWMIWKLNCVILKNEKKFEEYLQEHEQKIIPKFKKYLKDYEKFRSEELQKNFEYKILRKIKL